MTEENLKKYFEIYTDCWKLFHKYSEPNNRDEFWHSLINESNNLYKKHGEIDFSKNMLLETISEIERIFKRQKLACKSYIRD